MFTGPKLVFVDFKMRCLFAPAKVLDFFMQRIPKGMFFYFALNSALI